MAHGTAESSISAADLSDLLSGAIREAQKVWQLLTGDADGPDHVPYGIDELCSLPVGPQQRAAPPAKSEVGDIGTGVLAQLLALTERAYAAVDGSEQGHDERGLGRAVPKHMLDGPAARVAAGTWGQRAAARREQYMQNVRQGRGYNTSMLAVHMCKGPEDLGGGAFGAGRGRPTGPQ